MCRSARVKLSDVGRAVGRLLEPLAVFLHFFSDGVEDVGDVIFVAPAVFEESADVHLFVFRS